MSYKSYKDLEIYQLAQELAVGIHEVSMHLPKFELYEEGSQIRRSAKSVVANIVEGFGRRRYKNEFIRFLTYVLASCDETKEHLELLYKTGSFKDEERYNFLLQKYSELGRKTFNFIKAVMTRHNRSSVDFTGIRDQASGTMS